MSLIRKTVSLVAGGLTASTLGFSAVSATNDIFDLSPDQPARVRADKDPAAIAAIPKDFKS